MRVFVGLSGGVDSAVSAALLKEQGHDVTGAFIKIWQPEFIECTWREDRLDAMRVCAALRIPFREIDLSKEYEGLVVRDMLRDYERGVTPNPDILCNSRIKFGAFFDWALSEGADFIATGHYARIIRHNDSMTLWRGIDRAKDQSYFLHRVHAEQLEKIMFPVGNFKKTEIRDKARSFGLPVAQKRDSQGLCFVGDVTLKDFLGRFIQLRKGDVIDEHGRVIGTHDGAGLYTPGQRHGFVIKHFGRKTEVYSVSRVDVISNTITVTAKKENATVSYVRVEDMHWIGGSAEAGALTAQTRYREEPLTVHVTVDGQCTTAAFGSPHLVAPGQSIVMYRDDVCLGGGSIV